MRVTNHSPREISRAEQQCMLPKSQCLRAGLTGPVLGQHTLKCPAISSELCTMGHGLAAAASMHYWTAGPYSIQPYIAFLTHQHNNRGYLGIFSRRLDTWFYRRLPAPQVVVHLTTGVLILPSTRNHGINDTRRAQYNTHLTLQHSTYSMVKYSCKLPPILKL